MDAEKVATQIVVFRLDIRELDRLDQIAKKEGRTRANLVRVAVRDYIKKAVA